MNRKNIMFAYLQTLLFQALYCVMYYFTIFKNRFYDTEIGRKICKSIQYAIYTMNTTVLHKHQDFPGNFVVLYSTFPKYNEISGEEPFYMSALNDVLVTLKPLSLDSRDLICMKYDEYNIYRLVNSATLIGSNPERAKPRFLTIEYFHKDMSEKVEIVLDKNDYYVNNELLSYTFIYKYLLYRNLPFVIDDAYVINIIDDKLNTLDLTPNKYVKITRTGYDIITA
jgi:hypothetical protein